MTTDNAMQSPDHLLEGIARDVHAARPAWGMQGIRAQLEELRDEGHNPAEVRKAALEAAHTPRFTSPKGIRWMLEDRLADRDEEHEAGPCAICGKPPHRCYLDRPPVARDEDRDDHRYTTKAAATRKAAGTRGRAQLEAQQ